VQFLKQNYHLLRNLTDTEHMIKSSTNERYNEYSERYQSLQHSQAP